MTPRAVPWLDWAEWEAVRELLTAPEPERRARGVQRVAAWRSRGRLPVSVETTACLVEIWLSERGAQPPSEVQLRLSYSMALLRMVNGICDPSQRGKAAGSVLTLARRLDLPPMLVDLRHAATHGSLPALPALQLGASQAMEWLLEKYWKQQHEQATALERDDREAAVRREVANALRRYRKWREGSMQKQLDQGQELTKISQDDTAATETRRCADTLAGSAVVVADGAIVDVFLDGNMLVPKATLGFDEASTGAGDAEVATLPWVRSEVDGVFTRLRCVWRPALAALRQRRPRIRGALLYGIIDRLTAEGGSPDTSLAGSSSDMEPSMQALSSQQRLRLGLLQRWAKFFMSSDERLWPALQDSSSATRGPDETCDSTPATELQYDETIAHCLRGMNEWVSPLLTEFYRSQTNQGNHESQTDQNMKIQKLASFGCTITALQRDPVGAVTQLQSRQATMQQASTIGASQASNKPGLASQNCEHLAAQLEQWRRHSVERRRLKSEEEANESAMRSTDRPIECGSGRDEQCFHGLWRVPVEYKPAAIGAPAPHGVDSDPSSRETTAGNMLHDNDSAETTVSLELPAFINLVSLYPSVPSPIGALASTSDDKSGIAVDHQAAETSTSSLQSDAAAAPADYARVHSGSYHVDSEGDPMGIDTLAWDSHGYSLPAPTAFDGSETIATSAPASRPVNCEGTAGARLLSAEDIRLHSATTSLVECL